MKENIIFWLSGPPICCKGVFDAVAKKWEGKVFYICTKKIDENRAKIFKENQCQSDNISYIFLNEQKDPSAYGMEFLKKHIEDIHVFNGYLTNIQYLKALIKWNDNAKVIVWAERIAFRSIYQGGVKRKIIDKLVTVKHQYYARELRDKISAFLPIGQKSVDLYRKLGWKNTKMFPFFYQPVMNDELPESMPVLDGTVKFVYLGRFSNAWKGTDLLIDACRKLKNENYTLEMVGGYGNYKEQTLAYISENPHLHFGGTWLIDEACDQLNRYDVCVVPSRYEGWNPTVNEALMAGIGCIATEESVSGEMIEAGDAGIVVDVDSDKIAKAMDYAMSHINRVNEWKRNAFSMRDKIRSESCAEYFISILNYLFYNDEKVPILPWRKEV